MVITVVVKALASGHLLLHGFTYQQMGDESPMRFALIFISAWTLMTISMMMPVPFFSSGRAVAGWQSVSASAANRTRTRVILRRLLLSLMLLMFLVSAKVSQP
jgi:hypothetical protein